MNRKDLGGALAGSGIVGVAFDLLLHSGELIATVLAFAAMNLDTVVAILGNLSTLAEGVAWLPRDLLRQLFFLSMFALILYRVGRLVVKWRQNA